ncbi:MAG: CYTH domain-containing protein [Clostridiales bacterium]|nr:CYTH domain-containing protein [Clostridiales bacterium]
MEIERKYLVKEMPQDLDRMKVLHIEQAYVSPRPVIRVRHILSDGEESFILTVKGKGRKVREEHELDLDREAYERLLAKKEGILLKKDRYLIPLEEGLTAELDVYEAPYAALRTVEVEFASEEDMERFQAPDWFGQEVSEDEWYSNSYLCTHIDQESER